MCRKEGKVIRTTEDCEDAKGGCDVITLREAKEGKGERR